MDNTRVVHIANAGGRKVDDDDRKTDEVAEEDGTAEPDQKSFKMRLLIGRDRWNKAVFAFLVRRKGLGDATVVKKVAKVVDSWGYRQIVIKTNG